MLDNWSNGITIKGMPYDYDTFYNTMCSDGAACEIETIEFSGDGLKYYSDVITVEYIYKESKPADLSYIKRNLDLSKLKKGMAKEVNLNLDYKVMDPIISLQGWAYIESYNYYDYDIYVKIDDAYYICTKVSRPDVNQYFGFLGTTNIGFNLKLPIESTTTENITFILISGDTYYEIVK